MLMTGLRSSAMVRPQARRFCEASCGAPRRRRLAMVTVNTTEDVLSEQQRAVLALSATGLVSDEVAAALQIPVYEVRAHLASAMVRLRARSRLEAVIIALRHGLILPPHD